jgi:hypothetical protein
MTDELQSSGPDAVHSRTSYSKATHSGSFSSNHVSAASAFAKHLEMVGIADLFAGVDVDQDGHWSLFNFRFPQCGLLRFGSNSSSLRRLIACNMPIRANIMGPPFSAASVTQCAAF